MAASLRCLESLPNSNEDSSLCCVFSFKKTNDSYSRSGLLCEHQVGASYLPNPAYALSVQNNNKVCKYRENTYSWMLGICRSKRSCLNVAYVGMNLFDRYLSVRMVNGKKLEMVSWLCLHLASSVNDKFSSHLSFREVANIVEDTYSLQDLQFLLFDILQVIDFRLFPYSPYSDGGKILESTGYSAIYSNYQSLLNGVCMKYDSLCVNPKSITYSCILLAWVFSYPSNKIPDELNYCKDVPSHDFELIVKWVRELFPMMSATCDQVIQYYIAKSDGKGVSPTSVHQLL